MNIWPVIADGWIAQTLIATSLLMAIVMLLREPVSHVFGARASYALWLLPALRTILPPLPLIGLLFPPVSGNAPAIEGAAADAGLVGTPDTSAALPMATEATTPGLLADPAPFSWLGGHMPAILMGFWLGAAAMWFTLQMLRYRHFLSRAMEDAVMLPRDGAIELWVSPIVSGPIAVGIFRRRILLPPDFLMRYAPEERALVLSHEAAHHARRDILANLAALMVRALHWWNPLAHAAYARFRADQELACDATVLARADAERRAAYGRTLIKSAVPRMPALVSALDPRIEFTRRICMMTKKPHGPLRLLTGAALASILIGGGVMATASGIAQNASPNRITLPAAPSAPAMPMAMQPGPAIKAVPIPPSAPAAPQPPRAPEAVAAIDAPEPPAPPELPAHGREMTIVTPRGTFHSYSELTPAEREQIRKAHETAREAIRASAEARREAALARVEAQREGEQARREGEQARREAAQARQEALQAAAEARAEALAGARAARADALAQARIAREQAMRAATAAQAHAFAEQERAIRDIPKMVEASFAASRARMVAACKAKGITMPQGSDFGALAMCGQNPGRTIRTALLAARNSIAASRELSEDARANALKGLDDAMADLDRQPTRH